MDKAARKKADFLDFNMMRRKLWKKTKFTKEEFENIKELINSAIYASKKGSKYLHKQA